MGLKERFLDFVGYQEPLTSEQADRVELAKEYLTVAYMKRKIPLPIYRMALDTLPKTLDLRQLASELHYKG